MVKIFIMIKKVMKTIKFEPTILLVLSLITLIQVSCIDESNVDSIDKDDFEIYITKDLIHYDYRVDYSSFNLDTIPLAETPFLTMEGIKSYDTVNHIINLKESKYILIYPSPSVYGQMFVLTIDKTPVYCGFFWSNFSSVLCNWIFIEEPNEYNGLSENQIQINAGYPNFSHFHGIDPREDPLIISAFAKYGKLTGDSKVYGNGLNFNLVITSKYDTSNLHLETPINALDLEPEPFIAYNEILTYDTAKHILELTIDHDEIEKRINGYGKQFVVSLDDIRKYSGLLIPITSSIVYSTITIIQPHYDLDSLQSNQIKISLGYPNESYFVGQDLRLSDDIVERLKQDNKIK
jgi:hypothetical protein